MASNIDSMQNYPTFNRANRPNELKSVLMNSYQPGTHVIHKVNMNYPQRGKNDCELFALNLTLNQLFIWKILLLICFSFQWYNF